MPAFFAAVPIEANLLFSLNGYPCKTKGVKVQHKDNPMTVIHTEFYQL
jgi:hypothetical protein